MPAAFTPSQVRNPLMTYPELIDLGPKAIFESVAEQLSL
jgi:hypothetical protein